MVTDFKNKDEENEILLDMDKLLPNHERVTWKKTVFISYTRYV